ncbi:MAG: phosphoribosylformylglycinamidine synthase subunit PurQ [Spirochaetia bacterium]|nr:phosphoribosylformylglycinamidine synthase subunit PurQ [Spirochaetia bacterium]
MKAGILVFPGINCDNDLKLVLNRVYNFQTEFLWHTNSFKVEHDIYFVPGGFSYGDYLRSGAMASRSLSLRSLKDAVSKGIPAVGICNGFQILTEASLLPGALVKNKTLKHIARWENLSAEGLFKNNFTEDYALPISHSEGNYLCDDNTLKELIENEQIIFKYKKNPNGSTENIAGIASKDYKILGLMPHPERAVFEAKDWPKNNANFGKLFFDFIFSKIYS